MLYTLTFRVFLLAVSTSVSIMVPYALKKFYHLQTCTPGVVDGAPGFSSLLCICALVHSAHVVGYLRDRGAKSAGHEREDSHIVGYRTTCG